VFGDDLFRLNEFAVLGQNSFRMNEVIVGYPTHCHVKLATSEKCIGFNDTCEWLFEIIVEFLADSLNEFIVSANVFLKILGSFDIGGKYLISESSGS
jgi:hypothetical protein